MSRSFRLLNVNSRSFLNKCDDFECLLPEYNPEVAVVTETWLCETISDTEILPPGYKMVRRDRGPRGGEVALVLKEYLVHSILNRVN